MGGAGGVVFWYAAQLIYYKIFGGFISVYLIQMGGDAITSFFKETVACVAANFGLLLVGQDVLDPGVEHIAILYNGSFITDRVRFNSSNGEVTYLVDPSLVPEGYVEAVTQIVQNRFTISTAILKNDYYRVVFQPSDSRENTSDSDACNRRSAM